MKAIENISQNLERILRKGLEESEQTAQIKLFNAEISLHKIQDSVFVFFHHLKPLRDKRVVSLYEIKAVESYYLFDTINLIPESLDDYGSEAYGRNVFKVFSDTIEFCKRINFEYDAFETALNNLNI